MENRNGEDKSAGNKAKSQWLLVGISFGAMFGLIFGMFFDNLALGMIFGSLFGMMIGSIIDLNTKGKDTSK